MSFLTTVKTTRPVGAEASNVVILEAIEAKTNQIRRHRPRRGSRLLCWLGVPPFLLVYDHLPTFIILLEGRTRMRVKLRATRRLRQMCRTMSRSHGPEDDDLRPEERVKRKEGPKAICLYVPRATEEEQTRLKQN